MDRETKIIKYDQYDSELFDCMKGVLWMLVFNETKILTFVKNIHSNISGILTKNY